jgi:hypothetical protein
MMRRFALLVFALLFTTNLFAQSAATIRQNLSNSFNRITYWMDSESNSKDDSLEQANKNFQKLLLTYTSKYPQMLQAQFNGIDGLKVVTSADGLLRIYSWDTGTGGTMHFFRDVVQYQSGKQTRSSTLNNFNREGETGYSYEAIHTLKTGSQNYYLINYKGIYSSKDVGEGIRIFCIDNGVLDTEVKLIKTQSGMHNSINYSYDFFSVVDWKVRPSILFNACTNELKIPLVNANQQVTKNFITYKFTGKYFEKVRLK